MWSNLLCRKIRRPGLDKLTPESIQLLAHCELLGYIGVKTKIEGRETVVSCASWGFLRATSSQNSGVHPYFNAERYNLDTPQ